MVTTEESKNITEETVAVKKKRSWGRMLLNFLMYGGWMLVIVLVVGIIIAVQVLTK
jgi:hypothetical protein